MEGILLFSDQFLAIASDLSLLAQENPVPDRPVLVHCKTVKGKGHLDFTCRMIARHGSRDIEVVFTVRNASIDRAQHAVLDAIANIQGLPSVASKADIWVARPAPGCSTDQVLPVECSSQMELVV